MRTRITPDELRMLADAMETLGSSPDETRAVYQFPPCDGDEPWRVEAHVFARDDGRVDIDLSSLRVLEPLPDRVR